MQVRPPDDELGVWQMPIPAQWPDEVLYDHSTALPWEQGGPSTA